MGKRRQKVRLDPADVEDAVTINRLRWIDGAGWVIKASQETRQLVEEDYGDVEEKNMGDTKSQLNPKKLLWIISMRFQTNRNRSDLTWLILSLTDTAISVC